MINGIIGIVIGAGLGYFIGKHMSKLGFGCPLICNPKISTIYFAVIGFLIASGN